MKKSVVRFLKIFRKKRPVMSSEEWFLHGDNAPIQTTTTVQDYLAAKGEPYSADLAPVDFSCFQR
jgi:hypothetical protein